MSSAPTAPPDQQHTIPVQRQRHDRQTRQSGIPLVRRYDAPPDKPLEALRRYAPPRRCRPRQPALPPGRPSAAPGLAPGSGHADCAPPLASGHRGRDDGHRRRCLPGHRTDRPAPQKSRSPTPARPGGGQRRTPTRPRPRRAHFRPHEELENPPRLPPEGRWSPPRRPSRRHYAQPRHDSLNHEVRHHFDLPTPILLQQPLADHDRSYRDFLYANYSHPGKPVSSGELKVSRREPEGLVS